ncbi:MAG TPA: hypothetical protein VGV09_15825 [Steroidobacteraceae bacterium]|nr:hypothetical protein [Steroidobacteraceae bacterium]
MRRSLSIGWILAIGAVLCASNRELKSAAAAATDAAPENPLGINLAAISYYSPEQPFLNLLKSGGSSSSISDETGWYTSTDSTWDTQEESYLQLDSDGYPTSLSASAALHGKQHFTYVKTALNFNLPRESPGQTAVYPPGRYRLKFTGRGTLRLAGDAGHAPGDTCPTDLSVSNSKTDSYASCTFTVSNPGGRSGILVEITAIASSADHPRDISVVRDVYASLYDAGGIFNPLFLTALGGFSGLRFMEWMKTNDEFSGYSDVGDVPGGATSLTLSTAWNDASGTYPIIFIDGERRNANFTHGSVSVNWSGGLASAIRSGGNTWRWGAQTYYAPFFVINKAWAHRTQPSNAFWSLKGGVPLEVIVALCNKLQANCQLNVPLTYSDSDIAAMARMVMSGTNMQPGYGALAAPLTASFELSNEVWNGAFPQYDLAASLGSFTWPASAPNGGNAAWNRNYFGMRTAQMAADLQTAVSPALFARVIPVLGAQAANPDTAKSALQTPYWSSGPASRYPIKAVAIAPYWGSNPSPGDCSAMTGQRDGGLNDFFATLTSRAGSTGYAYSSVPSGGYLGQAEEWIGNYAKLISAYPSLKLVAYESGQNFLATTSGTCAGWSKLVTAAERDPRMGAAYGSYLRYWQSHVGATAANINNLFNDVFPISSYGAWGLLESVMQPLSPLSSAPPKYQAAINYIHAK